MARNEEVKVRGVWERESLLALLRLLRPNLAELLGEPSSLP